MDFILDPYISLYLRKYHISARQLFVVFHIRFIKRLKGLKANESSSYIQTTVSLNVQLPLVSKSEYIKLCEK
jgi:hypothetical protein